MVTNRTGEGTDALAEAALAEAQPPRNTVATTIILHIGQSCGDAQHSIFA
jgi:hypothetical protein